MIADDHAGDRWRHGAKFFEIFQPPAVSVDLVRDQREKNSRDSMLVHHGNRVLEFCERQRFGLEIDTPKSVDLKIEPAGRWEG